jgi:hypothetical protein
MILMTEEDDGGLMPAGPQAEYAKGSIRINEWITAAGEKRTGLFMTHGVPKISGVRFCHMTLILRIFLRSTVPFDRLEINCLKGP